MRLIIEVPALKNRTHQPCDPKIVGSSTPSGGVKTLYQFFDFPHLDILLCSVWLTHVGQRQMNSLGKGVCRLDQMVMIWKKEAIFWLVLFLYLYVPRIIPRPGIP